ncbi:MAG: hypothetical protein ACK4ND_03710 [Cytophagaceae bacterium]
MVSLFPIIVAGLLFIYFFGDEILELFFQESFSAGSFLLPFQLIGDFFRMFSYLLAFIISAQARIYLFISSQALSAGLYIILVWLGVEYFQLEGLPIAHAVRFFVFFIFTALVYRKLLLKDYR